MTCAIISRPTVKIEAINEFEPPCCKMKEELRQMIWKLYCEGYTEFYSNCEYGVPLWCAEIIIALKMYNDIKLHIAMPYEEQATNWGEVYRDRFFTVHERADTVKLISNHYAEDCYDSSDEYMKSMSDKCVYV